MTPKIDRRRSLTQRRTALHHKLESLRQTRDRQLEALNKTLNAIADHKVQIIMVDNEIAALIDASLHRMEQYHQQDQDLEHENSM